GVCGGVALLRGLPPDFLRTPSACCALRADALRLRRRSEQVLRGLRGPIFGNGASARFASRQRREPLQQCAAVGAVADGGEEGGDVEALAGEELAGRLEVAP